jgi:hypothetical protein
VEKDFTLHGEFKSVGELEAVGSEELDAVVLPWIVRGGDDNAGVEAMMAGEEGDGRGGDDAGGFNLGASFTETCGESGGDPGAGLACVAAKDDFGMAVHFAEGVSQGEAYGEDCGGVEWRFAGDGADAVSAEELAGIFGHGLNSWNGGAWKWILVSLKG